MEDDVSSITEQVDTEMLDLFTATLQEYKAVEKMTGFELAKFIADKAMLMEQSIQIINDIAAEFRVSTPTDTKALYEPFKFMELAGTTLSNHFLAWSYARIHLFNRQNARVSK
jgi:hypothetical protein